jgi:hypothetical protein
MTTQNSINNALATTALSGALQTAQVPAFSGGDVTGAGNSLVLSLASNSVVTAKINNTAVTYAKIQNVANVSLLGNPTGTPIAPEEITLGTGLSFSGTVLNAAWTPPTMVVSTGTTQACAINTTYVANNAGVCTMTLPATAAVGSVVGFRNLLGGFLIAQNASQLVKVGNQSTTTGITGSVASQAVGDCVNYECVVANTTWIAAVTQGNVTVV